MAFFGDKKKKKKKAKRKEDGDKKHKRRKPSVVSTKAKGSTCSARSSTLRRRHPSRDQRRQIRPHFIVDPTTRRLVQVNLQNPTSQYADQIGYTRSSDNMALGTAVVRRPEMRRKPVREPSIVSAQPDKEKSGLHRKKSWAEHPADLGADIDDSTISRKGSTSRARRPKKKNFGMSTKRKPKRSAGDVKEWLAWRVMVNEQLTSFVLRNRELEGGACGLPAGGFPRTLKEDKMNVIFHHALTRERPQTALDNLSYMIYGIPRVKIETKRKPRSPAPDYTDSDALAYSGSHELTTSTMISEPEPPSPPRAAQSPRRRDKSQVNNTGAYVPPLQIRPPQARNQHSPRRPKVIEDRSLYHNGYSLDRVLQARPPTKYLSPPISNHLPISPGAYNNLSTKPPIAGAVPTVLSMCSLQHVPSQADLRHVNRRVYGSSPALNPQPRLLSPDRFGGHRRRPHPQGRPGHAM
ncbi:hypothetical protein CAPTEDRAFT_215488 [Capitella teleta]|uniref:Uncharacterized protein n=1 Tax=Capitella teleta TaxID=283909 RepID=R7TYZ0_CAPTE|nr:hypothetical protein CAPTEDRAFT_215488 [Capitella teleta]|eukprot:ELT99153.1 hypothetical protein CAPTEDRAFT_215488 [Capitella teleta]